MSDYTEVKTLLGHHNLAFSIECLLSFTKNASEKIWLKIFEDGTLTPEDRQQLQTELYPCSIIDCAACDTIILKKLADYPACLQYRKTTVYARKIFDLMLYEEGNTLYIDSDIYFLKKFSLPTFNNEPVFMYDSENAYSFKPSEFMRIHLPIFPRVNSGFFYFPKSQFDLQFIENLLQDKIINKGYLRGISWLEQTTWSFLASRYAALRYFDPLEIVMATEILTINQHTICVHLVSTYRNHFEKVKEYAQQLEVNETATIRLVPAQAPLKAHHFYAERVVKRLKRQWKTFRGPAK